MSKQPTIPMSPTQLPQQRVYEVVDLPKRPNSFNCRVGYGCSPRDGLPKTGLDNATYLCQAERGAQNGSQRACDERCCLVIAPARRGARKKPKINGLWCAMHRPARGYWRTGWDSNPRRALTLTPLAGERLQPLGHLSVLCNPL